MCAVCVSLQFQKFFLHFLEQSTCLLLLRAVSVTAISLTAISLTAISLTAISLTVIVPFLFLLPIQVHLCVFVTQVLPRRGQQGRCHRVDQMPLGLTC